MVVSVVLPLLLARCACMEFPLVILGGDTDVADAGPPDAGPADASSCAGDSHEPDGDFAQALQVPPVYSIGSPVVFADLVACAGDVDHFHALSDCCVYAGAEAHWDGAQGQLQVDLQWPDGGLIALDAAEDVQILDAGYLYRAHANHGGRFVVRVHNPGTMDIPYRLDVIAPVFGP